MVVHMANWEPAEAGRQAILPVVIRDAQRALELDPAHGIRMHLREAEHQLVVLQLRHDHGSPFVSHVFQQEIALLGLESSPSYVREPEGNGCAERFIRTLKEQLLWLRRFETVEELRLALLEFKDRYNNEWLIERHGWISPAEQRRRLTGIQAAA